jgi:hypothetical protein
MNITELTGHKPIMINPDWILDAMKALWVMTDQVGEQYSKQK